MTTAQTIVVVAYGAIGFFIVLYCLFGEHCATRRQPLDDKPRKPPRESADSGWVAMPARGEEAMSALRELRCILSRPFGHKWKDVPGRYATVAAYGKPPGAVSSIRLGPLRVCSNCGAEERENGE